MCSLNEIKFLICEGGNLSLGRIAFWAIFFLCYVYWVVGLAQRVNDPTITMDVPAGLLATLTVTLGYNLGTKYVTAYGIKKNGANGGVDNGTDK
jgi:hypothetical protein